jgi:hypothetical protein
VAAVAKRSRISRRPSLWLTVDTAWDRARAGCDSKRPAAKTFAWRREEAEPLTKRLTPEVLASRRSIRLLYSEKYASIIDTCYIIFSAGLRANMLEPNRDRPGISYQAPQVQAARADPSAPLLWSAPADASSEAAFCSAWLSIQCARISGVTAGLIMLPQQQQPSPSVSACWPTRDLAGLADLSKLATRAFLERRTLHSRPLPIARSHPRSSLWWLFRSGRGDRSSRSSPSS